MIMVSMGCNESLFLRRTEEMQPRRLNCERIQCHRQPWNPESRDTCSESCMQDVREIDGIRNSMECQCTLWRSCLKSCMASNLFDGISFDTPIGSVRRDIRHGDLSTAAPGGLPMPQPSTMTQKVRKTCSSSREHAGTRTAHRFGTKGLTSRYLPTILGGIPSLLEQRSCHPGDEKS